MRSAGAIWRRTRVEHLPRVHGSVWIRVQRFIARGGARTTGWTSLPRLVAYGKSTPRLRRLESRWRRLGGVMDASDLAQHGGGLARSTKSLGWVGLARAPRSYSRRGLCQAPEKHDGLGAHRTNMRRLGLGKTRQVGLPGQRRSRVLGGRVADRRCIGRALGPGRRPVPALVPGHTARSGALGAGRAWGRG